MRKILLNLAVSLDGFIEGPDGEFDWCFTDQDYGMTEFMERIDTIFMGRKSYELVLQMDKNPYPDKILVVFSTTMKNAEGNLKIIGKNFENEVKSILGQEGKDIWLFGGSNLIAGMMNAGLVDELHLAVHPKLLGGGKPLFQGIIGRINSDLLDTKTYSSGLVQLFYEVQK